MKPVRVSDKSNSTKNLTITISSTNSSCLSQDMMGLNTRRIRTKHFNECGTRLQGKLDECNRCRYVWNHWYGTTVMFSSTDEGTRNKEQSS